MAENMTRASIIIVNYNTYTLLSECLNSIQPVLSEVDEVIVVDNNSTNEKDRLIPFDFPWVRYFRSEKNVGVGAGNNIGAEMAKGKFLAFINPDITVTEGWLDCLIYALESHPQAGMVTPKILVMQDPTKINTCGLDVHISGLSLCRGLEKTIDNFNKYEEVNAVSGTAYVIRKELFNHLGGYDENVFLYMEDIDISMRCRLAGYKCLFDPNAIVHHKYTLSIGPKKILYQELHRYLILLKVHRYLTLLILLPSLILAEIITWGFVVLRDRRNWKNKLVAYQQVFRNWKSIREIHKRTQLLRKVTDRQLIRSHKFKLEYEQTGKGVISVIAHLVFDSLFFLFSILTWLLLWW